MQMKETSPSRSSPWEEDKVLFQFCLQRRGQTKFEIADVVFSQLETEMHMQYRGSNLPTVSETFTKFNTVTSIYWWLGSPQNVAKGLFVEACITFETLALFSTTTGSEYPSEIEAEEKIALNLICYIFFMEGLHIVEQSKAHACCAVRVNLCHKDRASSESCISYEFFWFGTLGMCEQLLCSEHIITVQQLQRCSPGGWAGTPTNSYTKTCWERWEKFRQEIKRKYWVWDITLMKAVLEGM